MFRQTLLKTLYYEMAPEKIPEVTERQSKDRFFHTLVKTYTEAPGILSVTMEERYMPYSVMYYIFMDTAYGRQEGDLGNPVLTQWILAFFREYQKEFLKEEYKNAENADSGHPDDKAGGQDYAHPDILECFEVGKIPSYRRHKYAYSDMEITRWEDVKNGNVKKDERRATFPGISFSPKHDR